MATSPAFPIPSRPVPALSEHLPWVRHYIREEKSGRAGYNFTVHFHASGHLRYEPAIPSKSYANLMPPRLVEGALAVRTDDLTPLGPWRLSADTGRPEVAQADPELALAEDLALRVRENTPFGVLEWTKVPAAGDGLITTSLQSLPGARVLRARLVEGADASGEGGTAGPIVIEQLLIDKRLRTRRTAFQLRVNPLHFWPTLSPGEPLREQVVALSTAGLRAAQDTLVRGSELPRPKMLEPTEDEYDAAGATVFSGDMVDKPLPRMFTLVSGAPGAPGASGRARS